jgi:hypothetical protein
VIIDAFRSAAVLLVGCAAAIASRQSLIANENLLFAQPSDFKVGYKSSHDNSTMTEFVPNDQTVDDWTEMLTVQVFRRATVDSATFLQGVGKRYIDACPGTTVEKGRMFTGTVNGYVVSMLLLRCPKNPSTGKPETTAFRVIKGNDALYSVQHAWRAVPSGQQLADAMAALGKVIVCDTRTQDHPCPSFDSLLPPK